MCVKGDNAAVYSCSPGNLKGDLLRKSMTLHAENTSCARHRVPAHLYRAARSGIRGGGLVLFRGTPTARREQRAKSCLQPTVWAGAPAAALRFSPQAPGDPAREPMTLLSPGGAPLPRGGEAMGLPPPRPTESCRSTTAPPRPGPSQTEGGRGRAGCRAPVVAVSLLVLHQTNDPTRPAPPFPTRVRGWGHSPGRGWAAAKGPRTSTQPASSPVKLPPRCLRCLFVPSRT